jgi:hypothetical protein
MNIENVDKVMEDINESNYEMSQINDALAKPMGGADAIDDDELENELNELEVRGNGKRHWVGFCGAGPRMCDSA